MTTAQVLETYQDADIVADQFRMGIYGVAAVEAMACGRLVISDVDQVVRDRVRSKTGLELPIWQSSAADLRANLVKVVEQVQAAREMAGAGKVFAREVHFGARSARVLAAALNLGG